jgi:hypothetical protein
MLHRITAKITPQMANKILIGLQSRPSEFALCLRNLEFPQPDTDPLGLVERLKDQISAYCHTWGQPSDKTAATVQTHGSIDGFHIRISALAEAVARILPPEQTYDIFQDILKTLPTENNIPVLADAELIRKRQEITRSQNLAALSLNPNARFHVVMNLTVAPAIDFIKQDLRRQTPAAEKVRQVLGNILQAPLTASTPQSTIPTHENLITAQLPTNIVLNCLSELRQDAGEYDRFLSDLQFPQHLDDPINLAGMLKDQVAEYLAGFRPGASPNAEAHTAPDRILSLAKTAIRTLPPEKIVEVFSQIYSTLPTTRNIPLLAHKRLEEFHNALLAAREAAQKPVSLAVLGDMHEFMQESQPTLEAYVNELRPQEQAANCVYTHLANMHFQAVYPVVYADSQIPEPNRPLPGTPAGAQTIVLSG